MSAIIGLDHLQLAMPRGREDDARAFYAGILGLTELAKPANLAARGGVWFKLGAKSHDSMSHDSMSHDSMSHDSMSHDSMSHDSMSHDSMSHDSMSHDSMSHDSMSHDSISHDSISHDSISHDSMSHGATALHLGVEADFRPARKAHPAFLVRDLAALRAALVQAGFAPYEDEPLAGYVRFYVADPFGNRLEFLQPELPR